MVIEINSCYEYSLIILKLLGIGCRLNGWSSGPHSGACRPHCVQIFLLSCWYTLAREMCGAILGPWKEVPIFNPPPSIASLSCYTSPSSMLFHCINLCWQQVLLAFWLEPEVAEGEYSSRHGAGSFKYCRPQFVLWPQHTSLCCSRSWQATQFWRMGGLWSRCMELTWTSWRKGSALVSWGHLR